jgi:hypothetical protein
MSYKEINVSSADVISICNEAMEVIEQYSETCESIYNKRKQDREDFRKQESDKFELYEEIHGGERASWHYYNIVNAGNLFSIVDSLASPYTKYKAKIQVLLNAANLSENITMNEGDVQELTDIKKAIFKQEIDFWIKAEPTYNSVFTDSDLVVQEPIKEATADNKTTDLTKPKDEDWSISANIEVNENELMAIGVLVLLVLGVLGSSLIFSPW